MAATAEVKETILFLPQEIVQKSVGFSLDVDKTLSNILFWPIFLTKVHTNEENWTPRGVGGGGGVPGALVNS